MEALFLGILIVGGATLFAVTGVIFSRKYICDHIDEGHNDVLVSLFIAAGMIYAVLLGFLVIAVWGAYVTAADNASSEATTLVALYRLSNGMQPSHGIKMRDLIRTYTSEVIEDEWPTLATKHPGSSRARRAIGNMDRSFATLDPAIKQLDMSVNGEFLHTVSDIVSKRNKRLVQAKDELPWVLWMGAIGGGILVIGMSFIIYMKRQWPQVLMTGALAMLISMLIFIMVLFSRPFAGPIALDSSSFQSTLKVLDDVDRGN